MPAPSVTCARRAVSPPSCVCAVWFGFYSRLGGGQAKHRLHIFPSTYTLRRALMACLAFARLLSSFSPPPTPSYAWPTASFSSPLPPPSTQLMAPSLPTLLPSSADTQLVAVSAKKQPTPRFHAAAPSLSLLLILLLLLLPLCSPHAITAAPTRAAYWAVYRTASRFTTLLLLLLWCPGNGPVAPPLRPPPRSLVVPTPGARARRQRQRRWRRRQRGGGGKRDGKGASRPRSQSPPPAKKARGGGGA